MDRLNTRRASRVVLKAARSPALSRYSSYWGELVPHNDLDYFNRWLFAFASVQTGWQRNCFIYQRLVRLGPTFTRSTLKRTLRRAGAGMFKVRLEGISRFRDHFWADPSFYRPARGEPFTECRDRLVRAVYGLGLAKVSFALELCFPLTCTVVCLDRHLLRLYDLEAEIGVTDSLYRDAESHWVRACCRAAVACPVIRHMYWDRVQKQEDTRYWSHVFEAEASLASAC